MYIVIDDTYFIPSIEEMIKNKESKVFSKPKLSNEYNCTRGKGVKMMYENIGRKFINIFQVVQTSGTVFNLQLNFINTF